MRTLVAVDITEDTEELEDRLRPLLARLQGPVDLVHVARPIRIEEAGSELRALLDAAATQQELGWEERMRQVQAALVPEGRRGELLVERDPSPARAIVRAVREHDLLVVGTHGRTGPARAWLGSVAERVIRTSPVPVLAVHGRSAGQGRLLLAVDLSATAPAREAEAVLEAGRAIGETFSMVVDVIHVRPPSAPATPESVLAWRQLEEAMHEVDRATRRRIREALARWPESVAGTALVETGDVVTTLIARAEGYDLLMLATHGREGLARMWLGSVAERVVRGCGVPVLVVPVTRPAS